MKHLKNLEFNVKQLNLLQFKIMVQKNKNRLALLLVANIIVWIFAFFFFLQPNYEHYLQLEEEVIHEKDEFLAWQTQRLKGPKDSQNSPLRSSQNIANIINNMMLKINARGLSLQSLQRLNANFAESVSLSLVLNGSYANLLILLQDFIAYSDAVILLKDFNFKQLGLADASKESANPGLQFILNLMIINIKIPKNMSFMFKMPKVTANPFCVAQKNLPVSFMKVDQRQYRRQTQNQSKNQNRDQTKSSIDALQQFELKDLQIIGFYSANKKSSAVFLLPDKRLQSAMLHSTIGKERARIIDINQLGVKIKLNNGNLMEIVNTFAGKGLCSAC